MTNQDKNIYIIGAGVSGLIAAQNLEQKGYVPTILEATGYIGGRVRTEIIDGWILDVGFQVLLDAYPMSKKYLNYADLDLQRLSPGTRIYTDNDSFIIGDPLRDISMLFPTLFSSIGSMCDKLKIFQLNLRLKNTPIATLFNKKEKTTLSYLQYLGFTDKIITQFFKPFFSGIFLECDLHTSSRMFEFIYKMFAEGFATLPKAGIGAIAKQLAGQLKTTQIQLNNEVQKVTTDFITMASGDQYPYDVCIVATDPSSFLEGYSVKNPTTNIEQIKEDFTEKEIQLAKNQNDIFEEKTGKSKNKHGLEINDSKIQEGVCIFPFRVKKNTNLETQCIFHDNKDNGLICATEVDDNRVMTKYGFCTDGKCSSNMFGTEKDMMGKSQKTLNGIPNKPGYCCFPFKGTKKEGHTEYTECKETDYGPICATSVYESDEIALDKTKSVVKGQIKTFGFCPITKNTTKTKSGKECIFPFISKVEGTKKLYNKCIIKPNHESDPAYSVKNLFVCPIKTNTKLGDIKGVDFDACEDHDSGEIDYSKWEYKKGLLIRKRGLSLTDLKKTKPSSCDLETYKHTYGAHRERTELTSAHRVVL